jgi:hypothetical protein
VFHPWLVVSSVFFVFFVFLVVFNWETHMFSENEGPAAGGPEEAKLNPPPKFVFPPGGPKPGERLEIPNEGPTVREIWWRYSAEGLLIERIDGPSGAANSYVI